VTIYHGVRLGIETFAVHLTGSGGLVSIDTDVFRLPVGLHRLLVLIQFEPNPPVGIRGTQRRIPLRVHVSALHRVQ
jgi:hypothetical protein